MKYEHGERRIGSAARYRLGGSVHSIQARKAWEDPGSWMPGVLLAMDGDTATVRFVDELDLRGGLPPDVQVGGADDGEMARGAFQIKEASLQGLPIGELVWVTERWGVLAFADEDGNAFALRPLTGMAGTIFVRAAASQLRFLLARFVEEVDGSEEDFEEALDEFVYGVVTGGDGIERFEIVPRAVAEDTAQVVNVVNSCSTWGEVRNEASRHQYQQLLARAGFDEDNPPGDDDPFDPNNVDGLQSADYPMTPEIAQDLYLPDDIKSDYGEWERRMVEGPVMTIPLKNGPAVVAELRRRGYQCTEDSRLLAMELDRFEWMGWQ